MKNSQQNPEPKKSFNWQSFGIHCTVRVGYIGLLDEVKCEKGTEEIK